MSEKQSTTENVNKSAQQTGKFKFISKILEQDTLLNEALFFKLNILKKRWKKWKVN